MLKHGMTRDRPSGLFLLVFKPSKGNLAQVGRLRRPGFGGCVLQSEAWSFGVQRRGQPLARTGSKGAQGAMSTGRLVVKYSDPAKTDVGESTWLLCFD